MAQKTQARIQVVRRAMGRVDQSQGAVLRAETAVRLKAARLKAVQLKEVQLKGAQLKGAQQVRAELAVIARRKGLLGIAAAGASVRRGNFVISISRKISHVSPRIVRVLNRPPVLTIAKCLANVKRAGVVAQMIARRGRRVRLALGAVRNSLLTAQSIVSVTTVAITIAQQNVAVVAQQGQQAPRNVAHFCHVRALKLVQRPTQCARSSANVMANFLNVKVLVAVPRGQQVRLAQVVFVGLGNRPIIHHATCA